MRINRVFKASAADAVRSCFPVAHQHCVARAPYQPRAWLDEEKYGLQRFCCRCCTQLSGCVPILCCSCILIAAARLVHTAHQPPEWLGEDHFGFTKIAIQLASFLVPAVITCRRSLVLEPCISHESS